MVAVLGACSFQHGFGPNRDGALPDDALQDAAPDGPDDAEQACSVGVASTTGTDRGRVGGNGGSENFGPLQCVNPNDRIVGIALRMSNQDTIYGQRSAQGIRIGCASVTVRASGTATVGTVTTYEILGTGGFDWAPSTWTTMTMCKPGWILSGMTAHTADGENLFLDVSITCSQIDLTGAVIATEVLRVDGSLNESQGADSASCDAGEIVVRMTNRSGAGLDSVNLWCTTPTCN
jgi:hypothetical protein